MKKRRTSETSSSSKSPAGAGAGATVPSGEDNNAEDEDSFHGRLVGALKEHKGMPMVCDWHAKKPTSFNDGCGLCSPGR